MKVNVLISFNICRMDCTRNLFVCHVKGSVKPSPDIVTRSEILKLIVESMGGIKVIKRIPNGIGYYKEGVSK